MLAATSPVDVLYADAMAAIASAAAFSVAAQSFRRARLAAFLEFACRAAAPRGASAAVPCSSCKCTIAMTLAVN